MNPASAQVSSQPALPHSQRVQEICSYAEPKRMTHAPAFVKGVIVPILDLRMKFKLSQVNYDSFTVVIVLNIGERVMGIVVDGVSDVITLAPEQLHPVPEFSSLVSSEHLLAIGSAAERMLILLDIEKLMSSAEMGLVSSLAH